MLKGIDEFCVWHWTNKSTLNKTNKYFRLRQYDVELDDSDIIMLNTNDVSPPKVICPREKNYQEVPWKGFSYFENGLLEVNVNKLVKIISIRVGSNTFKEVTR